MKTINVCIGSACHLKGAYDVINRIELLIKEKDLGDRVTLKGAFCLGECTKAVSVRIDDGPIHSLAIKDVDNFIVEHIL